MNEIELQELQEMLFVQSKSITIILFFTALIVIGVFIDLLFHLYKKYIKRKEKENEKNN